MIIIPVSLPLSRSPSLFFGSLALSSPAGLAGTPSSPSPSPHLSHTLQSGTTEDRPFLPPEVLQQIVQETLRLDMAMLGVFNRVSNTFRELIKPLHPSIYINDSLAGDIKLNKDNLIYITVRKIYNNAGCGSGLALRLKGFLKKEELAKRTPGTEARCIWQVCHKRCLPSIMFFYYSFFVLFGTSFFAIPFICKCTYYCSKCICPEMLVFYYSFLFCFCDKCYTMYNIHLCLRCML